MSSERPAPVGLYDLLQDFQCAAASVRVLRLGGTGDAVGGHIHHHSMQIYLALQGTVIIDIDGTETVLEPYACLEVPANQVHSATPVGGDAVVVNISIPPLGTDDQVPVAPAASHDGYRAP